MTVTEVQSAATKFGGGVRKRPPRSLADIVVLANMAARARDPGDRSAPPHEPALAQLAKESEAETRGLVAALRS